MAHARYDKANQSLGKAEINLVTDTIKAVLVDEGAYTPDLAAHQFLSDIPAGARLATAALTTKSVSTSGVFDADDVTFTSVPAGTNGEAVALYQDTGSAATSRLISYDNTATGLPVDPDGGNIKVTWDNTANKIFKI